jgi:hypothetical protein
MLEAHVSRPNIGFAPAAAEALLCEKAGGFLRRSYGGARYY